MIGADAIIRQTRLVKYLFLLASSAVLGFILLQMMPIEQVIVEDASLKKNIPGLSQDFGLTIDSSVLEGVNKHRLPYKIMAASVMRKRDMTYNLQEINASYNTFDGTVKIVSKIGYLDEEAKLFNLTEGVEVIFNEIKLYTDRLNVDLHNNSLSTNMPVELTFGKSVINAASFTTENENNIVNFKGNVTSLFDLQDF